MPFRPLLLILLASGASWAADAADDAARQALQALVPGVRITKSLGGGHERRSVASPFGLLTGAGGEGRGVGRNLLPATDPHRAVKAFLDRHRAIFGHGSEVLAAAALERDASAGGIRSVLWRQQAAGIPVDGAILSAHLSGKGALIAVHDGFSLLAMPDAAPAPRVDAGTALLAAVGLAGAAQVSEAPAAGDPQRRQRITATGVHGAAYAGLAWTSRLGVPVLCWRLDYTRAADSLDRRALVDAASGAVLAQVISTVQCSWAAGHEHAIRPPAAPPAPAPGERGATAPPTTTADAAATIALRVFDAPNESPRPLLPGRASSGQAGNQPAEILRNLVTLQSLDATASPDGWISSGIISSGNNVNAYLDTDANDLPDAGRPTGSGSPLSFDFPLDLALDPSDSSYRKAAVTNLFYWCNWSHDRLYQLGFTEAFGNYQQNNFGRGGVGGDPVLAEAQDGSDINNANFSPGVDGQPGRMQMFLFNATTPHRDGDLDATVIIHEYVHGLSNRLAGGGAAALGGLQAGGLGEGWSDFYAISLLSQSGDDPNGNYAVGSYLVADYYRGVRSYPYTTSLARNPLTLASIEGMGEVHDIGTVWCTALWEMRCELVQRLGFAAGNQLALQLVTDGLKLSPATPTFIEARDAILQADIAVNDGANLGALWTAFARRGMGLGASVPDASSTTGVGASSTLPPDLFAVVGSTLGGGRIDLVGDPGGPFSSSVPVLSLRNLAAASLNWSASVDVPWLSLSSPGGSLPSGSGVDLGLDANALAEALAPGYYTANLSLANTSTGSGDLVIPIGLAVCYDYVASSPAYAWVNPSGHAVLSLPDDGVSPAQALPFAFTFYGQPVTQIHVGSNGLIGLSSAGLSAWENSDLPASSLPNGIICPFWDDLYPPQAGAQVRIGTVGSAPNRRSVITWSAMPQVNALGSGFTFQAILSEGSNDITFQYQEVRPALAGYGAGRSATVGIEQCSGLRASRASFNGSSLLANGSAIRFSPGVGVHLLPPATTSVAESAGVLDFGIALDHAVTRDVLVAWSSSGTASGGIDFSPAGGTVTVPAGSILANLPISILDDAGVEASETFTISLASASGGRLRSPLSGAITITDNDVPGNLAPIVQAGADQVISLPAAAVLAATAGDDGLPAASTLTYAWTAISGPGTVAFSAAQALDGTATFSAAGTYVLQIAVSDGVASGSDQLTVTVQAAAMPPRGGPGGGGGGGGCGLGFGSGLGLVLACGLLLRGRRRRPPPAAA